MSELEPKQNKSRREKIADALTTLGVSVVYPEVVPPPRPRPATRLAKVGEALSTLGGSLVIPDESELKLPHDINRLTP